MPTITITVPNVAKNIKWIGNNGLHEKITDALVNDDNAYEIDDTDNNKFSQDEVNTLKQEIGPAAAAFKGASDKKIALDAAVVAATTAATAATAGGTDLPAAELTKLVTAINTYNGVVVGGHSKRGGSKRRGSKKRRGYKSKGRKH